MRPKIFTLFLAVFLIGNFASHAQAIELLSPNEEIKVSVNLADKIYYTISHGSDVLLENNSASLNLMLFPGFSSIGSYSPVLHPPLTQSTSFINLI